MVANRAAAAVRGECSDALCRADRPDAGSIAEFGFNVPRLVDERGVLIAGHGRLLAARKLHLAEVPVIRLDHLTDAQARAFRIADNQIAVNADWDEATLSAELARLKEDGFDLDLLWRHAVGRTRLSARSAT